MLHKGKFLVFLFSALTILYGVAAAFYQNDAYPALTVFMDALKRIGSDYVEAPNMNKVQDGAMKGLIDALDPYSAFLTKEEAQALDGRKDRMADVGVVLSRRASILCVVAVEKDGPAFRAGMRPGDYVTAIDGVNVEDTSIVEGDSLLRGMAGSKVKVAVFRGSQVKPIEIEMSRKAEAPVAVASRMLDGRIGLLEVSSLSVPTLEQVRVKLKTLVSAGAQKFILDLRDCADGQPEQGAELANLFMKDGSIYTSKGREGEVIQEVRANPEKCVTDLPIAVLINASTAGPAEIASGALKSGGRAQIVGEKSFGMGSAQKRFPLKSGSVLILSVAKFYTPDGKAIENDEIFRETGIKPNVEWPDQDRLQELLVDSYFDAQEDGAKYRQLRDKIGQEQIDKAVEVLAKGVLATKKAA